MGKCALVRSGVPRETSVRLSRYPAGIAVAPRDRHPAAGGASLPAGRSLASTRSKGSNTSDRSRKSRGGWAEDRVAPNVIIELTPETTEEIDRGPTMRI